MSKDKEINKVGSFDALSKLLNKNQIKFTPFPIANKPRLEHTTYLMPISSLKEDGENHINVSASARTSLGKALNTVSPLEFEIDIYGKFVSIEGLLAFYNKGLMAEEVEKDILHPIRTLDGRGVIKKFGTNYARNDQNRYLVVCALASRILSHKEVQAALIDSGVLPFDSYVFGKYDQAKKIIRIADSHWLPTFLYRVRRLLTNIAKRQDKPENLLPKLNAIVNGFKPKTSSPIFGVCLSSSLSKMPKDTLIVKDNRDGTLQLTPAGQKKAFEKLENELAREAVKQERKKENEYNAQFDVIRAGGLDTTNTAAHVNLPVSLNSKHFSITDPDVPVTSKFQKLTGDYERAIKRGDKKAAKAISLELDEVINTSLVPMAVDRLRVAEASSEPTVIENPSGETLPPA